MPELIGISELGRRLGRSERQLRRLADAGKIPRTPDRKFDEGQVRKALGERARNSKLPYRHRPLKEPALTGRTPPVRTRADARAAVSLIREVLAEEGRPITGRPTFDDVRTVETVLKSRERALKLEQRRSDLISKDWAKQAAFAFMRQERDALILLPSRISATLAAELNCDSHALEAALNREIAAHLLRAANIDPEAFAASLERSPRKV